MEESLIITKVKNIYIMLLNAITNDNIDKVDHYLDDRLAVKYRKIVADNIKHNVRQKYDMLNITDVEIIDKNDKMVRVNALVRYADYKVDRRTNKIVSGNNFQRVNLNVELTFRLNEIKDIVYKCPTCASNLDINGGSFCMYCGAPIDERYSPLVLTDISYR